MGEGGVLVGYIIIAIETGRGEADAQIKFPAARSASLDCAIQY